MPLFIDLTGQRFGLLVVLRRVGDRIPPNGKPVVYWLCRCNCGTEKEILAKSLRAEATKSCGCLLGSPTHGHTAGMKVSRTYKSWDAMKARCLNPNNIGYASYAGRGITICPRWLGEYGFEKFLDDMGERPEGTSLDRFPNRNGNYEKSNCRWATSTEQNNNRSNVRLDLNQKQ